MARMKFGNEWERVVTRKEFSLAKTRKVLKNETVAVLGYGVQGPAQALNMRDNGIDVIIGQWPGDKVYWKKAIADGWVPGETLFEVEEAAERYGVPCVPGDQVERVALELGAPIPAKLWPQKIGD